MPAVVGVFKSRADAERGIAKLREIGIREDRINLQARDALRGRYPRMYDTEPFRHGYERGQAYRRALQKRRGASSGKI